MSIFVDTSALYALLDRDDRNHTAAAARWARISPSGDPVFTHNYVLVEVSALVQRRLGMSALRALIDELLRPVELVWVNAEVHHRAVGSLLAGPRRLVSLVDWVSFHLMRQLAIQKAFAFDADFQRQGFTLV